MEVPLVAAADPFVGRSLAGRYRVERKLGEGGMGAVYAGEHLLIQRPVAIKILHPQLATNVDLVRRFLNEARAVTAIRHEHIVDVTDMGQLDDGALFMVLELLDGRDFAALIEEESPLPIARVLHIVDQMCAALELAHGRGIVHRDLKPENVFLVRRGEDPDFVKILDFGIAKILDGDGSGVRTQTGVAMGTLHYMPPEQVQGGKDLDHRADVYAIGVILFRALGGRFPFEGDTLASLLSKILLDPIPPLRSVRPAAPLELEAIVTRCLSKRAADRFASCAELRAALRAVPPRVSSAIAFANTAVAPAAEQPTRQRDQDTRAFGDVERPRRATDASPPAAPAAPKPWIALAAGAAVLGALAIVGTVLALGSSRPVATPPAPAIAETAAPAPPTPAPPSAAPPAAPAPEQVAAVIEEPPPEPPPSTPVVEAPVPEARPGRPRRSTSTP